MAVGNLGAHRTLTAYVGFLGASYIIRAAVELEYLRLVECVGLRSAPVILIAPADTGCEHLRFSC